MKQFTEAQAKALLVPMFTKATISGRNYKIWLVGERSASIHITTINSQASRIECVLDKLIKHNGGQRYCRNTHSVGMLGKGREVGIVFELDGNEQPPNETYTTDLWQKF